MYMRCQGYLFSIGMYVHTPLGVGRILAMGIDELVVGLETSVKTFWPSEVTPVCLPEYTRPAQTPFYQAVMANLQPLPLPPAAYFPLPRV